MITRLAILAIFPLIGLLAAKLLVARLRHLPPATDPDAHILEQVDSARGRSREDRERLFGKIKDHLAL